MSIKLFWLVLILLSQLVQAQNHSYKPFALRYDLDNTDLTPIYIVPEKSTIDKNQNIADKQPDFAGFSIPARLKFHDYAQEITVHPDTIIWRIKLEIPGAADLGIVFSEFNLPEDAQLFIYDENKQHIIGAFSSEHNNPSGLFSTQALPASNLILEYYQPSYAQKPQFIIDEIIYLINNAYSPVVLKNLDPCLVNINCPEGADWHMQKRGIARILLREGNSWWWCTGSLINNTRFDGTPYMLTADHCGDKSTEEDFMVWQFVFNYEYNTCQSQNTNPPTNQMITGSSLKARGGLNGGSDFKLLLLNSTPPASWNVYYNGWSRRGGFPSSGVSIHHPTGDVKKIATFKTHLNNATYTGGMFNGFWRVVWAETESGHGITQGGSSGAPLFDSNGLIIGTLTGGSATCDNPTLSDIYGKFSRHWNANGTLPHQSLVSWLDPDNTDPMLIYGHDPLLNTNLVVIDIEPVGTGTVSGAGYFVEGENVRLIATPSENYVFDRWTNQLNETVNLEREFNFSMPAQQVLLTANFRLIETIIPEPTDSSEVKIYPNPVFHTLTIESLFTGDHIQFILYNINGQKILEQTLPKNEDYIWYINMQGITEGVYFLQIIADNRQFTQKIFVIR